MTSAAVTRLELDLDVFAGPLDLLLSLILREELDLESASRVPGSGAWCCRLPRVGQITATRAILTPHNANLVPLDQNCATTRASARR